VHGKGRREGLRGAGRLRSPGPGEGGRRLVGVEAQLGEGRVAVVRLGRVGRRQAGGRRAVVRVGREVRLGRRDRLEVWSHSPTGRLELVHCGLPFYHEQVVLVVLLRNQHPDVCVVVFEPEVVSVVPIDLVLLLIVVDEVLI
jgi:hypothetical protein